MAATFNKFKILIIEDEPGFRRTYTDMFTHFGHTVLQAEDGEEGVRLAKTKRPDLILLDLVLPKLSGYEVLAKVRQDPETRAIPVIIFSVLGEQTDIQKALDLGANDYLVKGSYAPREVLGKIGAFLAQAQT